MLGQIAWAKREDPDQTPQHAVYIIYRYPTSSDTSTGSYMYLFI